MSTPVRTSEAPQTAARPPSLPEPPPRSRTAPTTSRRRPRTATECQSSPGHDGKWWSYESWSFSAMPVPGQAGPLQGPAAVLPISSGAWIGAQSLRRPAHWIRYPVHPDPTEAGSRTKGLGDRRPARRRRWNETQGHRPRFPHAVEADLQPSFAMARRRRLAISHPGSPAPIASGSKPRAVTTDVIRIGMRRRPLQLRCDA